MLRLVARNGCLGSQKLLSVCGGVKSARSICGTCVQYGTYSLAEFGKIERFVQNALRVFTFVLVHVTRDKNLLNSRAVSTDCLSPESPHDTKIPISLTRCLSPAAGVVRPSCPQTNYRFPISPQTLAPTPRKLQPNPSSLCSSLLHYLFSKPFS